MVSRPTQDLLYPHAVVIVTGACGGIGEAIARAFADAGATLALCDLRQEELDELAKSLCEQVKVHHSAVDVTDTSAVQQFCDASA